MFNSLSINIEHSTLNIALQIHSVISRPPRATSRNAVAARESSPDLLKTNLTDRGELNSGTFTATR
jgi:hypothetical protein